MKRSLLRLVVSTPLALVLLSLLVVQPAMAQGVQENKGSSSGSAGGNVPSPALYNWCVGQASASGSIWGNLNGGIKPINLVSTWSGDNDVWSLAVSNTSRTADGYKIQVNYWNSVLSGVAGQGGTSIGWSTGDICIQFDNGANPTSRFKINYSADAPVPSATEVAWATSTTPDHSAMFPWYGHATYSYPDTAIQANYPNGSTSGGPTGYPSIWLGCSWSDGNSCTYCPEIGAVLNPEWYGVANSGAENGNTSPRLLPRQLKHVTSIPASWTIAYPSATGTRSDPYQVWDAGFDIWFDKTGDPDKGIAPYSSTGGRGQNDGLEIMVWMDHNHSYVDGPDTTDSPGGKNANGYTQPSGWPHESVLINNVVYDVWTSRLNNPYFTYPTGDPRHTAYIGTGAEPYTCSTLRAAGAASDVACGVEWNVVSFVAQNGYRQQQMNMDARVFADYILGINQGCDSTGNCLWQVVPGSSDGTSRNSNGVLACPGTSLGSSQKTLAQTLNGGTVAPIDCLNESWVLTSVQAGFEPWVGGIGLETTGFQSYALVTDAAVQSGRTADQPVPATPVVFWGEPFEVVYNGCSTVSSSNSASFSIALPDGRTWPTDGTYQDMGAQQASGQFVYTVPVLYPLHGDATINFQSACGNVAVTIFIDPSGQVFYSDGVTPASGAMATLLYAPSGSASGPFTAAPNHNEGLGTSYVMDPYDNTMNPMPTDKYGSYGWDVAQNGYYQVQATMNGCGAVTSPVQHVVSTPIMNLNLVLPCPPPSPYHNLNTTLTITNNWTTGGKYGKGGYCATVNGTNNTGAALDWIAGFTLTDLGTLYDDWNGNFTQSGSSLTVSGIAWNNILQPGQSLSSVGFCVDRIASVPVPPPPTMYSLSVSKTGNGTVASSPAGISCGSTCNVNFASGTSVTLTATPASGSVFAGWSGGVCSGTGTCTVAMSAAQSVTATFNTIPSYTLSVTKAGSGSGTVAATSPLNSINCGSTCSATYTSGTSVTLTATPASGSVFAGWGGGVCSGTGTCTVTMNSNQTVTATFNPSAGGVTVTPVIKQNTTYFTEEDVKIANTASLTALKVTIVMQRASGLSYSGEYNTVGSQITQANSSTASAITYTFTLASGKTVSAGTNWLFGGQANGTGKVHPTAGDTYTVTYTTGGVTYTQTGHF